MMTLDESKASVSYANYDDNSSKNFNEEKCRLLSFNSWPECYPVNPSRLAKAGFYYTGKGDEVVCFSCNGHLSDWQYGTIVQKRHIDSFPHCDFVNEKSDNVPLLSRKADIIQNKKISTSVDQFSPPNDRNNSLEDSDTAVNSNSLDSSDSLNSVINLRSCRSSCFKEHSDVTTKKYSSKMISEKERLKTFLYGWPVPGISINLLAKAGFFYTGFKDKVQCAFCHGIVKNWQSGDVPIVEHRRHFPSCEYVQKNKISPSEVSDGECIQSMSVEVPLLMNCKLLNQAQQHTLDELGVSVYQGPVHPNLATLNARLQSFSTWPETALVPKESLSAAGFFYIGANDQTKCFHCGGGLHCWEEGDDPWVEHARWFQNCSFLRLNRGIKFIDFVKSHLVSERKDSEDALSSQKSNVRCEKQNEVADNNETQDSKLNAEIISDFKNIIDDSSSRIGLPECNISLSDDCVKSLSNKSGFPCGNNEKLHSLVSYKDQNMIGDQGLCKVCMDNEVNVAFLPCGHVLACNHCAPALTECPACYKSIQATVRVYLQ